ncbi:hypothetical protein CVIRNUC_009838 [Coccomyxa viridis]|uniref:Protein kinase domain-containing protein n=1 Tax=Coccomyxa viridis TaxID=1274662 RepID=A0AAV1IHQ1_9CHLO|nr:hypothetical protein CVIRNUC_009838 [Coccomyxa viridis]
MSRRETCSTAVLLYLLWAGVLAVDPHDPDEVAPVEIMLCGAISVDALFSSSRQLRTTLSTGWGKGVANFTTSADGVLNFVNGTCDAIVNVGPLSESQVAPLVRDLNRTIMQIPFAVGSGKLVHSWQRWQGDGQKLYMTPDVLADIYQCNITWLDDPRIKAINPKLSLAHVPIVPVAARGSADASIIRRHLAALAPAWRLGTDHARALPACVRPNATYADFLRNDTFYIQIARHATQMWALPGLVVMREQNTSSSTDSTQLSLPSGSALAEWASFSPVGRTAGYNARTEREMLKWDYLVFFVFDQDSFSRGYPIGRQIRQLGKLLLSDYIQSQLPAFSFQPLSSLHLPPQTISGYLEDVQSVKCKCTPEMPYTVGRMSEQMIIRGQPNFNPLMQSALKGYKNSAVAWLPNMEYANTVDTFRYPKKTADMLVMDDAVMADVLLAKQRVGVSLVQVPFAMDAVVIAHSLPGVKSDELCMDAQTISDILQCRITAWDHPNITRLNPSVRLPQQPINVTIDSANLAIAHALGKFLSALAPSWQLGSDYLVQWPSCVHQELSLYGKLSQSHPFETNYTFGFQQLTAYDQDLPGNSIKVVNAHGSCLSPLNITARSLTAVNISAVTPQQWQNFTWATSKAPDVYPLGMMGFMIWDANSTDIGYEEGLMLKNITSRLLSQAVQDSMPDVGLVPTYQNCSVQIEQTSVQETPGADAAEPPGIPFNYTVTGCSSANGYNSFEAILWRDYESQQGRPFLLDTMYSSDTEAVAAFLNSSPDRGQDCDFALVWEPVPAEAMAKASRRVLHIPIGFAPLPIIHNFEGIADKELHLDAHALAGLYSCKIRSFDGYIQLINPNLTLPKGNITVVAMPKSGSSSQHLINYIKQDPLWDDSLQIAAEWPSCIWTTKVKPHSGRVSQLMLENPNSLLGFQPIGHFLTIQILTEIGAAQNQSQNSFEVANPLAAVWNSVLNGLWKMNSSLPVERSAMIQNAQGAYLGVHPVPDLDFPWEKEQLPGDFRSSAWAAVRDPVDNEAKNAYPIGQMMWVVADEDIGRKGPVHAKRMKSFLRYVETGRARMDFQQLDESSGAVKYQKALSIVDSVVPLPKDLMSWALQGIRNLSYDPLPPLPSAAPAPAPSLSRLGRAKVEASSAAAGPTVHVHVAIGMAVTAALVLGLVVAALLIWRRERLSARSAMRGPLSAGLTLRGSGSVPSGSLNLTLELDGKGEPLLLGQGSSAKVYKGRWNGMLVAVKVLHTSVGEVMADFQRECAILERLRHSHVIMYLGMASNAEGQVMMVMEYMQGGDLGTALARDTSSPRRLGWYSRGRHIALGIARGLMYLHAQKVISFDVKPANVLLDRSMKHAKLADVGLAKVLERSLTMTVMRGTLDYMAPEVFRAYSEDDEGATEAPKKQPVTQAVDIYSFGLVLWQLLTGEHPDKTQGSLRRPRVPEECPAEIAQLYQACLSELPAQRPKAADLVRVIACAESAADAGGEGARSASLAGRSSLRWLSRQRQQ